MSQPVRNHLSKWIILLLIGILVLSGCSAAQAPREEPAYDQSMGAAPAAPAIFCDREYMRLSLINLIVNAVQSIDDSGDVRIECSEKDGMTSLTVSDTGAGIPEDELDRIFEPYYSTKKLGIGIGLAITKRFVEEHGGTISALCEVGRGTTMTIRLPYHEG